MHWRFDGLMKRQLKSLISFQSEGVNIEKIVNSFNNTYIFD